MVEAAQGGGGASTRLGGTRPPNLCVCLMGPGVCAQGGKAHQACEAGG